MLAKEIIGRGLGEGRQGYSTGKMLLEDEDIVTQGELLCHDISISP